MNEWSTKPYRNCARADRPHVEAISSWVQTFKRSAICDLRLRSNPERRAGFSLLEMIIATAILAASGMVLSSLLGLGARYGNRAEERTLAIEQAHSVLAQFLAQAPNAESLDEVSGELPGVPVNSFRIRVEAYTPSGNSAAPLGQFLRRVTVEVFAGTANAASDTKQPICRVSQLVRAHQLNVGEDVSALSKNGESGATPSLRGQGGAL